MAYVNYSGKKLTFLFHVLHDFNFSHWVKRAGQQSLLLYFQKRKNKIAAKFLGGVSPPVPPAARSLLSQQKLNIQKTYAATKQSRLTNYLFQLPNLYYERVCVLFTKLSFFSGDS